MLWLQDPNKSNVDNLNSAICEASTQFTNKKDIRKLKLINLKLTVR
jgi:hypothetical protein